MERPQLKSTMAPRLWSRPEAFQKLRCRCCSRDQQMIARAYRRHRADGVRYRRPPAGGHRRRPLRCAAAAGSPRRRRPSPRPPGTPGPWRGASSPPTLGRSPSRHARRARADQAPSLHGADRPLEFRLRADEHAKDGKDPIFRNRPALVTREDILARLNTIRRARGPYAARQALGAVRRVFNFAADHGHAGIKVSPAANLRDKSVGLTGAMIRRQRILIEDEIKAVWHAASDAGMFGILVKCLSEDSIGPPRRLAGQATANTKSQPRQQRFSCRSRAQPQVAPP